MMKEATREIGLAIRHGITCYLSEISEWEEKQRMLKKVGDTTVDLGNYLKCATCNRISKIYNHTALLCIFCKNSTEFEDVVTKAIVSVRCGLHSNRALVKITDYSSGIIAEIFVCRVCGAEYRPYSSPLKEIEGSRSRRL